jgi:D-alanine--poly(phosphoribitol) ligase subunit 2
MDMDVQLMVLETLRQVAGSEEVVSNPDLPLFESGLLDSMNVAELLAGLSARFQTEIPLTAFDQREWATPANVVSEVRRILRI